MNHDMFPHRIQLIRIQHRIINHRSTRISSKRHLTSLYIIHDCFLLLQILPLVFLLVVFPNLVYLGLLVHVLSLALLYGLFGLPNAALLVGDLLLNLLYPPIHLLHSSLFLFHSRPDDINILQLPNLQFYSPIQPLWRLTLPQGKRLPHHLYPYRNLELYHVLFLTIYHEIWLEQDSRLFLNLKILKHLPIAIKISRQRPRQRLPLKLHSKISQLIPIANHIHIQLTLEHPKKNPKPPLPSRTNKKPLNHIFVNFILVLNYYYYKANKYLLRRKIFKATSYDTFKLARMRVEMAQKGIR